jgi:hypothetical protein
MLALAASGSSNENRRDLTATRWQVFPMGTIWKIIRIIGLYVAFFIASAIISAVILDSLPDAVEGLFILFAPVIAIVWYEKRRTTKMPARNTPASNNPIRRRWLAPDEREVQDSEMAARPEYRDVVTPAHRPISQGSKGSGNAPTGMVAANTVSPRSKVDDQSKSPDDSVPSRTRELRERLFGEDSSIFDPKNTDRVQAIASRRSAAGAEDEPDGPMEPAPSQAYRPQQDNAELVRVGKAARAALEAASLRRAAEKHAGARQAEGSSSTEGPIGSEVAASALARPSRIEELRQKLFGGDPRPFTPLTPAEPRPPNRAAGSAVKVQGWVPKGQRITIAGREIDGMVYVGTPPKMNSHGYGEKCRAYIDPSLSVASSGSDRNGNGMPYWPGYSSIPAICRAT